MEGLEYKLRKGLECRLNLVLVYRLWHMLKLGLVYR